MGRLFHVRVVVTHTGNRVFEALGTRCRCLDDIKFFVHVWSVVFISFTLFYILFDEICLSLRICVLRGKVGRRGWRRRGTRKVSPVVTFHKKFTCFLGPGS
jgi:hypothetical protein